MWLALLSNMALAQAPWWDGAWSHRNRLTFENASRGENLDGFVVLVRINTGRITYAQAQPDGGDLRFVDDDHTTLLPYEIERWNPGGESLVWVRVPRIDANSSSDVIWMYYGNAGASDGWNAGNTWDSAFTGVWHLASMNDSAGGNNGANQGTSDAGGIIGRARYFDGNDRIDIPNENQFDYDNNFTVSAWVQLQQFNTEWSPIFAKGDSQWRLHRHNTSAHLAGGRTYDPPGPNNDYNEDTESTTSITANGDWVWVAMVEGTTTSKLYINGVEEDSGPNNHQLNAANNGVSIGWNSENTHRYWQGWIDEVRAETAARSGHWMNAQYASMTDTLITWCVGQPEVWYNGTDEDCSGGSDYDQDGDGYTMAGAPEGSANDCDDTDANEDIGVDTYLDADGDGVGAGAPLYECAPSTGRSATAGDCDDNPLLCGDDCVPGKSLDTTGGGMGDGIVDIADGYDNDCTGGEECFEDGDGDSFGSTNVTDDNGDGVCNQSDKESDLSTDCDDGDDNAFPGQVWYGDCDEDGAYDNGTSGHMVSSCLAADAVVAITAMSTCSPTSTLAVLSAVGTDCDDADSDARPGQTWYEDGDGDLFGNPSSSRSQCLAPGANWVLDNTDCDDADIDEKPGQTWYEDLDVDGFGNPGSATVQCQRPAGHVLDNTDCNDASGDERPGQTWYEDFDVDGFGDAASTTVQCSQPSGYVLDSTDCDDDDFDEKPGAVWFADGDTDSWGTGDGVASCSRPAQLGPDAVTRGGDCDDTTGMVSPDAQEICNGGVDDNCDDEADDLDDDLDLSSRTPWYLDEDGDDFGAGDPVYSCAQPVVADEVWVAVAGDCDADDPLSYPGADEICDGFSNDCDIEIDEDVVYTNWWADTDFDDYGDPNTSVFDCKPPDDGGVWWPADAAREDCDDGNYNINPGAVEYCTPTVDENCDGDNTANAFDVFTLWIDLDQDGWGGTPTSLFTCSPGVNDVVVGGDCDDEDDEIHPEHAELCTPYDDNCFPPDDDDPVDVGEWYEDEDGDGFAGTLQEGCVPDGAVTRSEDCDEDDDSVNEGATEVPGNGKDDDCDPGTSDKVSVSDTDDTDDTAHTADTGETDVVVLTDSGGLLKTLPPVGCSCSAQGDARFGLFLLPLVVLWRRRRVS